MRTLHLRRGFTLIELLIVIAIIGILAALLIPVIVAARCRAKEGATQTLLTQIVCACTAYQSDYGVYPMASTDRASTPRTSGLVQRLWTWPLSAGRSQPYHDFNARDIDSSGNIVSALGFEVYYQENASVRPKQPAPSMMKPVGVDIWTAPCGSNNAGTPDALKTEPGILKNW